MNEPEDNQWWTRDLDRKFQIEETAWISVSKVEQGFRFFSGDPFQGHFEKFIATEQKMRLYVYRMIYDWGGDPQVARLAFQHHGLKVSFSVRVNMDTYKSFLAQHRTDLRST